MVVVELCNATCLNGKSCKNKRKYGIYCNVHKEKDNSTIQKLDTNEIDTNEIDTKTITIII
jgi:hypothetical protein